MNKTHQALMSRVKRLHESLDNEGISYGELVELDSIAAQLGVEETEEMTATDVLIEVEDRLSI